MREKEKKSLELKRKGNEIKWENMKINGENIEWTQEERRKKKR